MREDGREAGGLPAIEQGSQWRHKLGWLVEVVDPFVRVPLAGMVATCDPAKVETGEEKQLLQVEGVLVRPLGGGGHCWAWPMGMFRRDFEPRQARAAETAVA